MSTFELAIQALLKDEGGFVDDPSDAGGATNRGISLRFLKSFGLKYDFNGDGVVDISDIRDMTLEQTNMVYRNEWWDKYQYGQLNNQMIATKIFDLSVNEGGAEAHKLAQRATWAINGYGTLDDDGILGEQSIKAINAMPVPLFLAAIKSEAAGFYRLLVAEHANDSKFLHGWLKRAYE